VSPQYDPSILKVDEPLLVTGVTTLPRQRVSSAALAWQANRVPAVDGGVVRRHLEEEGRRLLGGCLSKHGGSENGEGASDECGFHRRSGCKWDGFVWR